jgi:hypothetical protein
MYGHNQGAGTVDVEEKPAKQRIRPQVLWTADGDTRVVI